VKRETTADIRDTGINNNKNIRRQVPFAIPTNRPASENGRIDDETGG